MYYRYLLLLLFNNILSFYYTYSNCFRTEVSDLERQVAIERNKYLEFTQKSSKPSVLPYLTIKNTVSVL